MENICHIHIFNEKIMKLIFKLNAIFQNIFFVRIRMIGRGFCRVKLIKIDVMQNGKKVKFVEIGEGHWGREIKLKNNE